MPEPAGSKTKVFICYAKEDHAFACDIFAALRENGVAAWMDRPPEAFALEGILPGQDSALRIEQRVGEADALLLILSPASIAQQGHVEAEFRLALHAAGRRGLRIIGLLQNACALPAFAAGGVALNALSWIDHGAQGFAPLLAAIKAAAPAEKPPQRPRAKKAGAIMQPRIRWRAFMG